MSIFLDLFSACAVPFTTIAIKDRVHFPHMNNCWVHWWFTGRSEILIFSILLTASALETHHCPDFSNLILLYPTRALQECHLMFSTTVTTRCSLSIWRSSVLRPISLNMLRVCYGVPQCVIWQTTLWLIFCLNICWLLYSYLCVRYLFNAVWMFTVNKAWMFTLNINQL